MIKNKCDVVIPIYNAPDWTKLCVYALMKNTDMHILNKVYLMNDASNEQTLNTLNNLQKKYKDKVEVITNKDNLGFVKNCNKALKLCEAEYVLLLNSDCLLSPKSIEKLISHMQKNKEVGLICPLASNAANLSLPIFDGFTYTQMDQLLENKFLGKTFDACTIVGNCLMIRNECLDKVGLLDEVYGMGYGEETDYQFKCMEKGYSAKVAIDTYVFHKAEVSFGVSEEKQKRLDANRKIFFDRWGNQYNKLLNEYKKNDPIEYILKNISEDEKTVKVDTLIYLPDIVQNAGGSHVVVDMVNYLTINGVSANIVYDSIRNYQEITLFTPIPMKNIKVVDCNKIMATIWYSVYNARKIADEKNIPLIYFVQGYEPYFSNAQDYGGVALSYKLSDSILTISSYLADKIKGLFDQESEVIPNGINYDLLFDNTSKNDAKTVTLFMRGNQMKGDFILLDIMKLLNKNNQNVRIKLIYVDEKMVFPELDNKNQVEYIKGPLSRVEVSKILKDTDIYVDCSLNEGFGLLGLESMFSRAVPVLSDSFGVREYLNDGENGFLIKEVNDANAYYEKIQLLLNNPDLFASMSENTDKIAMRFDYDRTIENIIKYFSKNHALNKEKQLTKYESDILDLYNKRVTPVIHRKKRVRLAFCLASKTPKRIKDKISHLCTVLVNILEN